jgi:hypothetical protein
VVDAVLVEEGVPVLVRVTVGVEVTAAEAVPV